MVGRASQTVGEKRSCRSESLGVNALPYGFFGTAKIVSSAEFVIIGCAAKTFCVRTQTVLQKIEIDRKKV